MLHCPCVLCTNSSNTTDVNGDNFASLYQFTAPITSMRVCPECVSCDESVREELRDSYMTIKRSLVYSRLENIMIFITTNITFLLLSMSVYEQQISLSIQTIQMPSRCNFDNIVSRAFYDDWLNTSLIARAPSGWLWTTMIQV